MDLTSRFSFGVNIDASWRFAGVKEPKSIIFPHLLSISIPEGRFLDELEEAEIRAHGDPEPRGGTARASLALADNLQSAGVDYVRCWFSWLFFEPKPVPAASLGELAESGYPEYPLDSFVDSLSAKDIGIIPVLACGYQRMLPEGLSVDADPTLYLRRAAVHAKLVVRRYKDRVKNWQIENEPNWWEMHETAGWRKGASWVDSKEFRDDLLKTLNEAVHEEDPSARTIINLEADKPIKAINEVAAACDLVGLDYYPNYRAADPINLSEFKTASEYSRAIGKPVFIAETGYPSGPSFLGYSSQKQAQYVELALREALATEGINAIGIWRYIDTAWRSFPEQENHFGLIDEKGGPKEAWYRLAHIIKELKGRGAS
ncbi:MAG: hypothetical protein JRM80_01685 [Nitrososphaerota archaeon]|nr:hypothetical protein [Nitrososphaerota archaeon]